ncbi:hypothetical protein DL769_005240 [Monosporascus sp. CRB-8-3]|nr:hypothetical protein DL769_005240 [Monosporascus sp. CRB-8-3]
MVQDTHSSSSAGISGARVESAQKPPFHIQAIKSLEHLRKFLPSLRTLLQLCVNQDPASSSIGFRAPLSGEAADEFWLATATKLTETPRVLHCFVLTADPAAADVLATGSIVTIPKVTHRHRAEIVKLLVHPSARRKGVATAMMHHLESFAKNSLGKEVLTLDTATTTPARAFYNNIGWKEWGTCPEYADFADGTRGDATFFVKVLRG